ncbi:MAG: hypothetical protein WDN25_07740 [Acetobacteraceae bacterium]
MSDLLAGSARQSRRPAIRTSFSRERIFWWARAREAGRAVRASYHLAISPDGANLYVTAVDDDARSTYRGQIVRLANPIAP